MVSKNEQVNKDYWEKNIEGFSGFYDTKSEENIQAPGFFAALYKGLAFPMEKKYMLARYNFVCNYIDENVKPGMKVADIGCGSGVYTKRMISKGAFVYATDYVESAISLTRKNLTKDEVRSVELLHSDVVKQAIPKVDLAISIGVLPYIDEADKYFGNILPFTDLFLFNFLDKNNLFNRLRSLMPLFDVRSYSYHSSSAINSHLENHGFGIRLQETLATGFLMDVKKAK